MVTKNVESYITKLRDVFCGQEVSLNQEWHCVRSIAEPGMSMGGVCISSPPPPTLPSGEGYDESVAWGVWEGILKGDPSKRGRWGGGEGITFISRK